MLLLKITLERSVLCSYLNNSVLSSSLYQPSYLLIRKFCLSSLSFPRNPFLHGLAIPFFLASPSLPRHQFLPRHPFLSILHFLASPSLPFLPSLKKRLSSPSFSRSSYLPFLSWYTCPCILLHLCYADIRLNKVHYFLLGTNPKLRDTFCKLYCTSLQQASLRSV